MRYTSIFSRWVHCVGRRVSIYPVPVREGPIQSDSPPAQHVLLRTVPLDSYDTKCDRTVDRTTQDMCLSPISPRFIIPLWLCMYAPLRLCSIPAPPLFPLLILPLVVPLLSYHRKCSESVRDAPFSNNGSCRDFCLALAGLSAGVQPRSSPLEASLHR